MTDPVPFGDDLFASQLELQQLRQRTLLGSVTTFAAQAIKSLCQFCSMVILARLLFPSDFGLLAMVGPIIAFVQILSDLGLGQIIIQREQMDAARVSTLFWIGTAVTLGLTIVVLLLAPVVAILYREPKLSNLTISLALLIPVSGLSICPNALLARHMRYGEIARIDVVTTLIGIVVSIACAFFDMGYWSLVAGQFAAALSAAALFWRACSWLPSRPTLTKTALHDLRFSGNLTLSNVATFISTFTDNIIVGLTSGSVALGFYDRSYRLVVQPINQILAPIAKVAVPLLSRLNSQNEQYRSAYFYMVKLIVLISVPAMLVCVIYGHAVVAIFLGPQWSAAGQIFSWICVGGIASGIFTSLSWIFISQGRANEMMRYTSVAAAINVLSFLIGARWGVVGVAAVSASTFVLVQTPLVAYGATRSGPITGSLFVMAIFPFCVCVIAGYCALSLIHYRYGFGDWADLVLNTAVSYGLFLTVFAAFPSGRSFLKSGCVHLWDLYRGRSAIN